MAKKSFKLVKASAALAVTAAALTPVMAAEASTSTVELKAEVVLGGKFKEALALNTPAGVEIKWGKYLVTAINKWQTVKGQGSDGKTYIKKLYARNYPLYILDQDLGEVEAGSELEKPSIRVMYRDGKVYTQAPERFTMSSTYNTKDEGEQKVLISYNHNGNRITSFLTYTVVASEVAFSNVSSSVDQANETLSVMADVANAKEDTMADVLVYPFKDASKAITVKAEIKDGKLTAKTSALPAGTHSFIVKSGEVMTEEMAFTVDAVDFTVKPVKANQLEVKFNKNITAADAADFKLDNGRYVTKVEVDADDKSKVWLTVNEDLYNGEEYKLTAKNFSIPSGEVSAEIAKEFKFEVEAAASITLTKTNFLDGEDIRDFLVVKDKNGLLLSNAGVVLSATSSALNTTTGEFAFSGTPSENTLFVEAKVVSNGETVATSGAIKVTVSDDQEVSAIDGIHIADAATEPSAYKQAKKDGKLDTDLKLAESGQILNVYVKDVTGEIQRLAVDSFTNLTPAVATVSKDVNGNLVIQAFSTGTAKVKVKNGNFETTVEFAVVANSKIADAKLSTTSLGFDSGNVAGVDTPQDVTVDFLDQYKEDFDATIESDGDVRVAGSKVGTLKVKSSNTQVATVEIGAGGAVEVSEGAKNGSATVTISFEDNSGKVVFTKSVAVKVSEFDATVASYDLVVTSANKSLDADVDVEGVTADADDEVMFELRGLDKYGNVIEVVEGATYDFTYSSTSHAPYFVEATNTLEFAEGAAQTFAASGKVTIKATVGGVQVDTVSVDYTNTDAVAKKAMVDASMRTFDLSSVDGLSIEQLLFGKTNASGTKKFIIQPAVSVQDQFGKAIAYDLDETIGTLANGVVLSADEYVVTNKVGVVVDANGVVTLAEGRTSGTFTVVVPQVESNVNGDLLSAPVAFDVKVVE
ncbi:hypothetical protein [Exiguobacterium sp. s59]|uniref:hypothetical protein n=1 Tax=Exiguobacterium sp. s59 TaxID=2751269 RepID=UPI001BEBDD58|nr:hypothetical protein [Exiguobacterium sp. s59]